MDRWIVALARCPRRGDKLIGKERLPFPVAQISYLGKDKHRRMVIVVEALVCRDIVNLPRPQAWVGGELLRELESELAGE